MDAEMAAHAIVRPAGERELDAGRYPDTIFWDGRKKHAATMANTKNQCFALLNHHGSDVDGVGDGGGRIATGCCC